MNPLRIAACVLMLLVHTACSSDAPTIDRIDPDTLITVVTADQLSNLDIHDTSNGGDIKVLRQVYESLIRVDPKDSNKLIPALASSWTTAENGRSITFTIREGVSFHDGAALDAAAAKLSLDRLLGVEKTLPVKDAPYRKSYTAISSVEADGMTLTVKLKRPAVRVVLRNLAMFPASMISPKFLESLRGKTAADASLAFRTSHSGTGPYKLKSFDSTTNKAHLEGFDDYWAGEPEIKNVLFKHVKEPKARFNQLMSGEADVVDDIARTQWGEVRGDLKLISFWAPNICYLGMNCVHDETEDIEVRLAIRLAIDHNELLPLFHKTARANYSLIPQSFPEYDEGYRAPGLELDLESRRNAARKLLTEVDAEERELTIYYPMIGRPYLPEPSKVADKLKQQLTAIGLNVSTESVLNDQLFGNIDSGDYELILIGWMSDNGDPDNFYSPLTDGAKGDPSPLNTSRHLDDDVHDMLMAAQGVEDLELRASAYRNIERRLQEEVVGYVPLVNTMQAIAVGKKISGVEVDGLGMYRLHTATFKK